jgi:hypothetical protein
LQRACVFGNRKLLDWLFPLELFARGCLETPFVHPIRLPKLRKRAAYGKSSDITILVATKSRDFTVLQVVPESLSHSLSLSLSHPPMSLVFYLENKSWLRAHRERERETERETFLHISIYFYWDKLIRYSLICRINLWSIYFRVSRKKLLGLWRSFSGSCLLNEQHKGCCVLESRNTYENLAQSLKKVLRFWGLACGRVFAGLKRLIAWLCIILSYEGLFVKIFHLRHTCWDRW